MKPKTFKKYFGAKVKDYRTYRDLTQAQLAEKLKVETSTIGKIEIGENFTTAELICDICDVLEIPPREFFDFDIKSEKSDYTDKIEEINEILKNCDSKKLGKIHTVIKCLAD